MRRRRWWVVVGSNRRRMCTDARSELVRVTTGSKELDRLLAGGVETGSITELFGEFRTGKTQLCLTMAVTCQLSMGMGGGEGKCLWIDTEGTFRPERLASVAERYNLDLDQVLANVSHGRAHTTDQQMSMLNKAAELLADDRYALIVVDSLMALYRVDYSGRGETRRSTAAPRSLPPPAPPARRPVRGRRRHHQSGHRPSRRRGRHVPGRQEARRRGISSLTPPPPESPSARGRGTTRVAKIYDSPCLPEDEAQFAILSNGIMDVPDDPKKPDKDD